MLTKRELFNGHYYVNELGKTRISVHVEYNCFHLKHTNILGSGQVWEVFDGNDYKNMIKHVKSLLIIQKGMVELSKYEVKP